MKNIHVLTYEYKQNLINHNPNIQIPKKTMVKYMNKHTDFLTITQETNKFSKHYSEIHEKVYKLPYDYSRKVYKN